MWLNFGEYQEVKNSKVLKTIILTLDAPTEEEVMNAENFDYLSKYPLNACYSKPLVDKKTRKKTELIWSAVHSRCSIWSAFNKRLVLLGNRWGIRS